MKKFLMRLLLILLWCGSHAPTPAFAQTDFLTDKEIEAIQENQEIHLRVKLYLEFAELRLKTAEDKLNGIEPVAGDPFELRMPEEMLNDYYRIVRSVMMNLDDAFQNPSPRTGPKLPQALKSLKGAAEKALGQLDILKRIAEEQKKEELWDRVNQAIDVTKGAKDGAEFGLSKYADPPARKKTK